MIVGNITTLHAFKPNRDESPAATPQARGSARCQSCCLRELCLPAGLADSELAQLEQIVTRKRPLKRGDHLYRAGDDLSSLFAVRTTADPA